MTIRRGDLTDPLVVGEGTDKTGGVKKSLRAFRGWTVGDRCRTVKLGEWKNGTIIGFAYDGEVAIVERDGESAPRHFLTGLDLRQAVDE